MLFDRTLRNLCFNIVTVGAFLYLYDNISFISGRLHAKDPVFAALFVIIWILYAFFHYYMIYSIATRPGEDASTQDSDHGDTEVYTDTVIILVHGTWGRGFFTRNIKKSSPRWFEENSLYRRVLQKQWFERNGKLPLIQAFLWSGNNSIVDRNTAGEQLAQLLRSNKIQNPGIRQVVVCHSHGGNVAVRAIEFLGDQDNNIDICTMACPFLEIKPMFGGRISQERYYFAICLWYCLCMGVGARLFFSEFPPATVVGVLGLMLLPSYLIRYFMTRERNKVISHGTNRSRKFSAMTSHNHLSRWKGKFLVLRGIDDEANFALVLTAFFVRSSRIIGGYTGLHAFRLTFALVFLAPLVYYIMYKFGVDESFRDYFIPIVPHILNFASYLFFCAAVSMILPTVFYSFYGRELLTEFLDAEVNVNSVPDFAGSITISTVTRGFSTTIASRHRIYHDQGCMDKFVEWASDRVSPDVRI